ncbi:hypothetical protein CBR_g35021 [Chara braunii]|uniref:Uncharacterized protein n=1 Tax=Chara braunii TaxID=69332 RepID=A0A388LK93_CHABU|nr:hypothetical protein CBR_g35021 [Chara braunii]|eukprot:GBG82655.1 hypothetical protein CBR_g35021 [Chara braunii]
MIISFGGMLEFAVIRKAISFFLCGLATTLGASIVFFARVANRVLLAVSLGASGGVMLFISFYGLLSKTSIDSFQAAGLSAGYSRLYALVSFFSGIMLLRLLDWSLHWLSEFAASNKVDLPELAAIHGDEHGLPQWVRSAEDQIRPDSESSSSDREQMVEVADEKGGDVERGESPQKMVQDKNHHSVPPTKAMSTLASKSPSSVCLIADASKCEHDQSAALAMPANRTHPDQLTSLMRTGALTAVVLGLHNFPEGIATFVSALQDAKLGVTMCLAIALHNIPEGVCVAMPVYYATKSKWKGFFWAFISGIAEPVGAVLAYAVLSNHMNDTAFGVLYAGIAGVMVGIVLSELLPAARKYDPQDKVVTTSIICGMLVMAVSLVLFDLPSF